MNKTNINKIMVNQPNPSLDEIATMGEEIYFKNKEKLENEHYGEFAIIDVDSEKIFVDADKLTAIQKAQAKYPNKLFYIVQIGNLKQSSIQEINENKRYGWSF